jgi:multiple sugar transport system permease protein
MAPRTETAILKDAEADRGFRVKWVANRLVTYGILIVRAIPCLFPIYWTVRNSLRMAPKVMKGAMIPYVDYGPTWLGFRSLGLSRYS